MVSISPVPKLEPGPVSYCQFAELGALPAGPAKLSLNSVVQPDGGGGTVPSAWTLLAVSRTAVAAETGRVAALWVCGPAWGAVRAVGAAVAACGVVIAIVAPTAAVTARTPRHLTHCRFMVPLASPRRLRSNLVMVPSV